MKILLAGILGGIVMFVGTSIAHMALPLGEAGIRQIPNESAVLSTMQCNIAAIQHRFPPVMLCFRHFIGRLNFAERHNFQMPFQETLRRGAAGKNEKNAGGDERLGD